MKKLCTAILGALALSSLLAPQAAATSTVEIVALGDSSASGAGAGDYLDGTGTPGGCWRSARSYSQLVAQKLASTGKNVSLTNVTCSGAATTDLAQPFRGQPPQLDSLKRTTSLVTLTIGGNDIGLAEYAGLCLQADCTGAPAQAVLGRMPALAGNLAKLLGQIKTRSPHATIVVTGYGRQVSPQDNAPGVPLDPICGPGVITTPERQEGAQIAATLDTVLRLDSYVARHTGSKTVYVSEFARPGTLRPQFAGHSLCEDKAQYYRGFDALAPGQEGPEAVLHLNQPGHAALAALITDQISR